MVPKAKRLIGVPSGLVSVCVMAGRCHVNHFGERAFYKLTLVAPLTARTSLPLGAMQQPFGDEDAA
jgi:hypothetical protein